MKELIVDVQDWDGEPVHYYLVVLGRFDRSTKDSHGELSNAGGIGRATGTVWGGNSDVFKFEGQLIGAQLSEHSDYTDDEKSWADVPIDVLVDGETVDVEDLDPGGYIGGPTVGPRLNGWKITADECDHLAKNWRQLKDLQNKAASGDTIGITADIQLPNDRDKPQFNQSELTIAGIDRNGHRPRLYQEGYPASEWGNVGFALTGDFCRVTNLRIQGPTRKGVHDREGANNVRGVQFHGDHCVADHCEAYHWSHAGICIRDGKALSVFNSTLRENWLEGLGYGVAMSGPVGINNVEVNEELEQRVRNEYLAHHERHTVKRCLSWACRHDIKGGSHTSYEYAYSLIESESFRGHRIDMHRPGGGTIHIHDVTLEHPKDGTIEGDKENEQGITIRGWPEDGCLIERVDFRWGELDPNNRYVGDAAPVTQECARSYSDWENDSVDHSADLRIVRDNWRHTPGEPFVNVHFKNCHAGTGSPEFRCGAPDSPFVGVENYIRISSTGGKSTYQFEVSDDLYPGKEFDTDGTDAISGSKGSGIVAGGGTDDFHFNGEFVDFSVGDPTNIEVVVNGEQIDLGGSDGGSGSGDSSSGDGSQSPSDGSDGSTSAMTLAEVKAALDASNVVYSEVDAGNTVVLTVAQKQN